ncbi:ABC transporter permease [Bacillus carboniphilus]|uniref:ABC transporter permease n=1 Tax=Bacillus carboniphilus TaxID=86663 RepID=A0ABN0W9U5_9BACI
MRTIALIKRIFIQMLREKRTLALLFVAPLFILSLMYILFNGEEVEPKIGVIGIDKSLHNQLIQSGLQLEEYTVGSDVSDLVLEEDLDGILQENQSRYELTLLNSDPTKSKSIQMRVNQVMAANAQLEIMKEIGTDWKKSPQVELNTAFIYGNQETSFFDVLSPILVGFFVFFFVFLISGIGLLKERTTGTLERLLSTPVRRGELVAAYLIGYGIFAVIQTFLVVFYSIMVLDMVLVGSIWLVIIVNLILALVALSLGTFLSAFAASEFQMMQFIPVIIVPQLFFSGIFPLDGMADWLQALAKVMPIYYAADALTGIMYKGYGVFEIGENLLVLVVFALIFILLNIAVLKRYRSL